jgi:AraC family transcriptional activator of pobA
MTYPKELWENTRLEDRNYPLNFFRNRWGEVRQGQNIMSLHWHEHLEWIVMIRGQAVFHIDSHPVHVVPGDILFVPPSGLHVGYSLVDEPLEYVSMVFNASLFRDYARDPLHERVVLPFLKGEASLPYLLPNIEEAKLTNYRSLIHQAIDSFEKKDAAAPLIAKSYLYLLFTLLAQQFPPPPSAKKLYDPTSPSMNRFKELFRHIEAHYAEKLTVEQAAKLVSLNPYHFCKTFKKLTGRTFIEYVNVCRVKEAERLLLETDLNITEIAGQVGCGNPNYFTKLFKQHTGIVPSQLRK